MKPEDVVTIIGSLRLVSSVGKKDEREKKQIETLIFFEMTAKQTLYRVYHYFLLFFFFFFFLNKKI